MKLPRNPGGRFFAGLSFLPNPLEGRLRWCEVRSASTGVIRAFDLANNLPITFGEDGASVDAPCRFLGEDQGRRREQAEAEADEAIAAFRARATAAAQMLDVTDETLTVIRNCIDIFESLQRKPDVSITPARAAVLSKALQRLGTKSADEVLKSMAATVLRELRNGEAEILAAGGLFSSPDNEQEPSRLYKGLRIARDYLDVFIADKNNVRGSLADKLVNHQVDPALEMLSWGKGGEEGDLLLERITPQELTAAFGPTRTLVTYQSWDADARANGYTDDSGWFVDQVNLDASDLLRLETHIDLCAPSASQPHRPKSRGMRL